MLNNISSIKEYLFAQPYRFNFFQAVRILKNKSFLDNENLSFDRVIRFTSSPYLYFPIGAVSKITKLVSSTHNSYLYQLETNFFGLFGLAGLLPRHYTELIIERLHLKDKALKDFLDLFNHRMLSLYYQSWEKNYFFIPYEQAKRNNKNTDRFTHIIDCLIGNGALSQQNRLIMDDDVVRYYASFFAKLRRSAINLQMMLADYLKVPVKIEQFQEKRLTINPKEQTCLSNKEEHYNRLGVHAILGKRIWSCGSHFRICVGPLSFIGFNELLPGSFKLAALIELTRRFVGICLSFDIQLILKAEAVPFCHLGEQKLGWNSWLQSKPPTQDATELILKADK